MILSPHEVAHLAAAHWTGDDLLTAVAVCLAESRGDTDVIARSTTGDNLGQRDHGLWQISGRWHGAKLAADPDWRDPIVNARLAKAVWGEFKRAGKDPWSAWAVYNSGSYKAYLPDARIGAAAPFPPPAALTAQAVVAAIARASRA